MANTFITPTAVARAAALLLRSNAVVSNLVSRDVEKTFVDKVGKTVTVKIPATFTANDMTGTTVTSQDITQTNVDVTIDRHFEVTVPITSDESTFELENFNEDVTKPAVIALIEAIDSYLIDKLVAGLAPNTVGTDGNAPSTVAHLVAGTKQMNTNKVPLSERYGVVDVDVEASLIQLAQFSSQDYAPDSKQAVIEGQLTRRYGVDWFMDQNATDLDQGDIAGTVLLDDAAATAGDSSITMDAFTAATGTVKKGTRFTIAGTATVYTVTADAAIASNEATVSISPVLSANETDNDAITFKTALTENVIFHRNCIAAAIIAPKPLMAGSATYTSEGLTVRTVMTQNAASLYDQITFDVYCGAIVVVTNGGVVVQG